jgi:Arc/MetJ-type ribon-helix-helix transcriptional regulator
MIDYHTEDVMPKTKLAVTLEADLVQHLDHLVDEHQFANRSQAIESAVAEKLARIAKTRLARECSKLEPAEEKALAEEGLAGSRDTWPEY